MRSMFSPRLGRSRASVCPSNGNESQPGPAGPMLLSTARNGAWRRAATRSSRRAKRIVRGLGRKQDLILHEPAASIDAVPMQHRIERIEERIEIDNPPAVGMAAVIGSLKAPTLQELSTNEGKLNGTDLRRRRGSRKGSACKAGGSAERGAWLASISDRAAKRVAARQAVDPGDRKPKVAVRWPQGDRAYRPDWRSGDSRRRHRPSRPATSRSVAVRCSRSAPCRRWLPRKHPGFPPASSAEPGRRPSADRRSTTKFPNEPSR